MLTIKRILVPVDFSPCSRAAFECAASLAGQLGASLEVLHVCVEPKFVGPDIAAALGQPPTTFKEYERATAAKEMEQFLATFPRTPKPVIKTRIELGEAYDTILKTAEQRNCDMIVMGTHGRTGLVHLVLGRVAERVVRHASCPVLTVGLADKAASVRAS